MEGAAKSTQKESELPATREATNTSKEEKLESTSDRGNAINSTAVNTMKLAVMMVLLSIVCGCGAYFLALKSRDDDSHPDIKYEDTSINLGIVPHLICVTIVKPAYDLYVDDVPYTACDYLVYYPDPEDLDDHVSLEIRGVKIIVGFNMETATAAYFANLSSWVGSKYAILDVDVKGDFSDVTTKTMQIKNAFSRIKKRYPQPELAIIGVKIQPKDADATKENGEKLGNMWKGALIIFQSHAPPDSKCVIGVNELMITKKNYENLAAGINSSVAISTTIGVVKFAAENKDKMNIGDPCTSWEVLPRSDNTCQNLSFIGDKGVAVKDGAVYVCNTNATAQALFVGASNESSSASWKFNIAFFDIDLYRPHNDSTCPMFHLTNFYRKGPRTIQGRA